MCVYVSNLMVCVCGLAGKKKKINILLTFIYSIFDMITDFIDALVNWYYFLLARLRSEVQQRLNTIIAVLLYLKFVRVKLR